MKFFSGSWVEDKTAAAMEIGLDMRIGIYLYRHDKCCELTTSGKDCCSLLDERLYASHRVTAQLTRAKVGRLMKDGLL